MSRDKMIFSLETLSAYLRNYNPKFFTEAVNKEAFANDLDEVTRMIKSSEPPVLKMIDGKRESLYVAGMFYGKCPVCGCLLVNRPDVKMVYCHQCGQGVKWE